MNRLESFTSRFCTTFGMALLIVSVLVAPNKLFADANSDCAAACCQSCFGTSTCSPALDSCYSNCDGTCLSCESMCGGNPTCQAMCLATAEQSQCPNNSSGTACADPGLRCYRNGIPDTCTWSGGKSNCTCGN